MKLYSLVEVAALLHISPGTARNRIARGDAMPPYFKVGRRLLFSEVELSHWLAQVANSVVPVNGDSGLKTNSMEGA